MAKYQSYFEKVRDFLREHGPCRAKTIIAQTGCSRSSLSQILFRSHRGSFVSSPLNGYSRAKLWSLAADTDPGFAQLTLRLPKEVVGKIQAIADQLDISEAAVVSLLLERYLGDG